MPAASTITSGTRALKFPCITEATKNAQTPNATDKIADRRHEATIMNMAQNETIRRNRLNLGEFPGLTESSSSRQHYYSKLFVLATCLLLNAMPMTCPAFPDPCGCCWHCCC